MSLLLLGAGLGSTVTPPPDYMVSGSIAADGWTMTASGTLPAGPVIESAVFDVVRDGYNSSGSATTVTDQMYVARRIRQPYPNQASLTASNASCSDFIYDTDVISGMTNNSALVSPKPIAKWVSLDRDVVGNSIAPEIVAFHRDGVAYVEFRATDGTTTVTAGTSSAVVLGGPYDKNAVVGYAATLDITSLNAGLITVHCKVYPRVGVAASVLDSADKSDRREFSARYYVKNTTLAASPYYVYVNASTGDDTTGAVSTTAATAEFSPVLTVAGALQRINAVVGDVDGCIIRFMAGTHTLNTPAANRSQEAGLVLLTRDPNASRASVILTWSGGTWTPKLVSGLNATVNTGCYRMQDVTLLRAAANSLSGDATYKLEIQFVDMDYDNATYNNALLGNSSAWWVGVNWTGATSAPSALQSATTGSHNLWRGFTGDLNRAGIDGYCVVGCEIFDGNQFLDSTTRTVNGKIIAFNRFEITAGAFTGPIFALTSGTLDLTEGAAVVQNVFEIASISSQTGPGPSADGQPCNTSHFIMLNNTVTGFNNIGRSNQLYDETTADLRTHTLHRVAGNIHVQLNTKHDVFKTDGTRVGGWSYLYGVGCEGEFVQFLDAASGGFAQDYPGKNADIGTSSVTRNDPLWTTYAGTIDAATTGANGGVYTLQGGSPCAGILPKRFLPFDLAGTARPATNDSAGAYAA